MYSENSQYDQQELRSLISAVVDGNSTEEERKTLTAMLRDIPAAQDEYLRYVDMQAVLLTELPNDGGAREDKSPRATAERPQAAWSSPANVGRILAVAACLLVVVGLVFRFADVIPNGDSADMAGADSNKRSFATVVQLTDASWPAQRELIQGDRLGSFTIRLSSGFVRIEFDSGVEVALEGPAVFELHSMDSTTLTSGLLTANVVSGAEGFTVNTPMAKVVDLGTSFGIDLRDNGFSNVSVFDGELEVALPDAKDKQLLTEGESVRIGRDQQIEKVAIEPDRYARVWPVSQWITGSTEVFRMLPPWPKRIHLVNSDRDIFVAAEGQPLTLAEDLRVDISTPGDYSLVSQLTPLDLAAGQRTRSYILHFHPVHALSIDRSTRVSGAITFDRPILGVIVLHEQLLASQRRFSWHGAGEAQLRRQVDLTGNRDGDHVSLSDDLRTLTVDLISPGRSSDLIRVIVDGRRQQDASPK